MIILTLIGIILAIIVGVILLVLVGVAAPILVIFGDLIIFVLIVSLIVKLSKLIRKKKKKDES